MTHASEPAWPTVEQRETQPGHYTPIQHPGLTKREAFAMAALQGLCASQGQQVQIHTEDGVLILPARRGIPFLAVEYADALLAQLSKDTPA